ncbi:glycosyltransferase family 2 protein [Novosphingobium sp.]|uniref:glycosyltransferase family 2 protein n=1 Tax=Novosphingobium sp. TaxID=1874826 RepID=UPI0025DF9BCA|nr:glycosyltransferase family 2 protein [Novosphingobium sp.]
MALCPEDHLRRFCEYYLDQGAARIHVYHDGPPDFATNDPRIAMTICDDAFWQDLDMERPFGVEERQRCVYRQAYARCHATWLLIVDIDEYVFGPAPLDTLLGTVDDKSDCVRFTSAEAVYCASDAVTCEFGASLFRLPMERHFSPLLARLIYGIRGGLFTRGLLGHSRGKQAVRSGNAALVIDIHDAGISASETIRFDATEHCGFHLAHYDAISFQCWAAKCADRLSRGDAQEMGRKREHQLQLFAACRSEDEREHLFRRLYALSPWQARLLERLGLLVKRPRALEDQGGRPIGSFADQALRSSPDLTIGQKLDA